jgi:hypothetical protein
MYARVAGNSTHKQEKMDINRFMAIHHVDESRQESCSNDMIVGIKTLGISPYGTDEVHKICLIIGNLPCNVWMAI